MQFSNQDCQVAYEIHIHYSVQWEKKIKLAMTNLTFFLIYSNYIPIWNASLQSLENMFYNQKQILRHITIALCKPLQKPKCLSSLVSRIIHRIQKLSRARPCPCQIKKKKSARNTFTTGQFHSGDHNRKDTCRIHLSLRETKAGQIFKHRASQWIQIEALRRKTPIWRGPWCQLSSTEIGLLPHVKATIKNCLKPSKAERDTGLS